MIDVCDVRPGSTGFSNPPKLCQHGAEPAARRDAMLLAMGFALTSSLVAPQGDSVLHKTSKE